MFEICTNGPLMRGVIKELFFSKLPEAPNPPFEQLSGPRSGPESLSYEDFGLQAILEKMNSLNTPPTQWTILEYFKDFWKTFDNFRSGPDGYPGRGFWASGNFGKDEFLNHPPTQWTILEYFKDFWKISDHFANFASTKNQWKFPESFVEDKGFQWR